VRWIDEALGIALERPLQPNAPRDAAEVAKVPDEPAEEPHALTH
jgi:hypothetical protein